MQVLNVHYRSSRGDPNKYKFIDKLNFKNGVRLRRKTTSKFFVGVTYKNREFNILPGFFDASNIFSHPFIQNLKNRPNMFQDLSIQTKLAIKT